jgi:hypothetical protein
MNTTMLTRPRVHNVYSGNRKDIRGLEFPDATLCEAKDAPRDGHLDIADVALKGVSFRSPRPLSPGKVQYLSAKGANSSTLSSTLRIVSCKLRGDGDFDVSAEFF